MLAQHPWLTKEADQISEKTAEILGATLDELREVEIWKSLSDFAAAQGVDLTELMLRHGCSTDKDFDRLMAGRQAQINRALGIE